MTTKPIQTLLRKQLAARILMWTCLAATLLPILAAVLFWDSKVRTEPLAGLGVAVAIHLWWPVPLVALIGFVLALEWKQGLGERIKKMQAGNESNGDGGTRGVPRSNRRTSATGG